MKKIILPFLFFTFSVSVLAQEFFQEQTSGVFTPLTSASGSPNAANGWICGFNGVVLKTTNGGNNWINVSAGIPAQTQLTNIFGVSNLTALTCGNQANETFVYRTTDGGATWQQVFAQLNGYMEAIWMKDAQNGFMYGDAVGNRWSLWKTTNGGANWDSAGLFLSNTFANEYGWNNAMYVNNNSIWFGTTNNKIYRSTDNGTSWISQSSPSLTTFSISIAPNAITGYATGSGLVKTTDAGATWTSLTMPGTGFYSAVTTTSTWVYFVRGNTIYKSTNSGSTWTVLHTAPSGNYRYMSHLRFGDLFWWAVRDNGGITLLGLMTPVKKISEVVPDRFELRQNYPNPFNPMTRIRFDISSPLPPSKGDFVSLKIYDVMGREVETLVNEELRAGVYEVEWDGSGFASGVYYYQLKIMNEELRIDYSETRKMVLVK